MRIRSKGCDHPPQSDDASAPPRAAEAEDTSLLVGINEALRRVAFQQCLAFGSGDAEYPTKLIGVDRFALGKLAVYRDRHPLVLRRERP